VLFGDGILSLRRFSIICSFVMFEGKGSETVFLKTVECHVFFGCMYSDCMLKLKEYSFSDYFTRFFD
jgi:hypothetical protein